MSEKVGLPKVAPYGGVAGRDTSEEDVGVLNGAEVAVFSCLGVVHLAAKRRFPVRDVFTASLVRARVEVNQLVLRTFDYTVGKTNRQHARHHVRKGRKTVHEDPEARERGRLSEDTTKDEAEREHQVGQVTTSLGGVETSDNHVRECRSEEQEHPRKEEELEATEGNGVGILCVLVQANRVVPAEEDEHSHEGVPGKFDNDVRDHECLPRIRLGRTFADLVQSTLGDEVRHDLLDQLTEDCHQHEDTEHLVLETRLSVGHLEERETDEESRKNTEEGLGVDVRGCAPVLLEDTDHGLAELNRERSGKLAEGSLVLALLSRQSTLESFSLATFGFELSKMALDFTEFLRVAPGLVPVNICV